MKKKTTLVLPDINVWLALVFDAHAHHRAAQQWRSTAGDQQLAFCRLTQQGFLRLSTNPKVLGTEALPLAKAWSLYDQLQAVDYVTFLSEPAAIESFWRKFTSGHTYSPKVWNDAYLAAFSLCAACRLVSFDRGVVQYDQIEYTLIEP